MHIFFLMLAAITASLIAITIQFVVGQHDLLMHFFSGLIATVSALITHCWVFFYFIGTGEGIRDGVLAHDLDMKAIKASKKFKAKTFPFALFSMIFMITAAIMGGALRFKRVDHTWHNGFVILAIAFNLFTFAQEFKIIRENRKLMKELNTTIEEKV